MSMWTEYELTFRFVDRLCGSVPQARELIRPWLEARAPERKPEAVLVADATGPVAVQPKTLDDIEAEVLETIGDGEVPSEDVQERITLGFHRDDTGLFVREGTIKAHIKDCANQVKDFLVKAGVASPRRKSSESIALRSLVANKVFVEPDRLYLYGSDGKPIQEPHGDVERPVHVITPAGPRNALKRVQYVVGAEITAYLKVLNDGVITTGILTAIFDYGSIHGYGGDRSLGEGRYTFTLREAE